MTSLADLVPELADGYRRRYVARQLGCATCGRLATHGQWSDGPDEQLVELPLCDDCPAPDGWEAA